MRPNTPESFAASPPEVSVEQNQPTNEDKDFILRSIEALRMVMMADITIEPKVPGTEAQVRPAFTDEEVQLIKSKIFKFISKL